MEIEAINQGNEEISGPFLEKIPDGLPGANNENGGNVINQVYKNQMDNINPDGKDNQPHINQKNFEAEQNFISGQSSFSEGTHFKFESNQQQNKLHPDTLPLDTNSGLNLNNQDNSHSYNIQPVSIFDPKQPLNLNVGSKEQFNPNVNFNFNSDLDANRVSENLGNQFANDAQNQNGIAGNNGMKAVPPEFRDHSRDTGDVLSMDQQVI